jgi:hypothetical protein
MSRSSSWHRNRILAALFLAAAALGGTPLRAQQLIVTLPTGATDPLKNPQSIAFDTLGNLFIADKGNARVQRLDKDTGIVSTVAGTGVAGYSGDGIATLQQLNCPTSLVFDAAGALYVADSCDNRVRKLTPATPGGPITRETSGTLSTYAGDGGVGQVQENVLASATHVAAPIALAIDSAGNLFISSKDDVAFTQAIRRVDGGTQLITTTSCLGDVATFSQLVTSSNELLIGWSNEIAFATHGGAPLTGNDNLNSIGLSAGLFAPDGFFRPSALAQDSGGNLYVVNGFAAPSDPAWIYRVAPGAGGLSAGTAAPFAGNSAADVGYDGDGGPPLLARMNNPQGLAVNSADNLYIADSGNNVIRAVVKATPTPAGSAQITPLDQHGAASAVDLTFSGGVTTAGDTAVVVGQLQQAVPQGFVLLGPTPLAFDVITSAQYSGLIVICINQPSIPAGARLLHFDPATQQPQDVTISVTPTRICGEVSSLSPFAIVVPVEHDEPPAITSSANATFQVGVAGAFSVTASGTPAPTLTETGALPNGIAFSAATGVLAGMPTAGGVYALTFTAHNGAGADAVQAFSLTVTQAPSITTPNSAAFAQGAAGTFTVRTAGFPLPRLQAASLPPGLVFLDNGDGSGTLNGIPTAAGSFPVVITASNGVGTSAQTLNVNISPAASTGGSLSVTPAQIDFGAFRFLHVSTREITLKNVGSTVVNLRDIDLTLGAGVPRDSFIDLNLCGSHLAPGKSCSVLIFYVTVRPGSHTATLRIDSDAAGSPQAVALKGTTLNW